VRLSRKPKVLVIMLVMSMFLLTQVGLLSAAQGVNWVSPWPEMFHKNGTITGTIYENNVSGNVYATVYASIGGEALTTPVVVSKYIYGSGQSFSIPLSSFTTLTVGDEYTVNLKVYSGTTAATISNTVYATIPSEPFTLLSSSSSSSSSGGGGGSSSSSTTTTSTTSTTSTASSTSDSTVSAAGTTVFIPAGALPGNCKVTVKIVTDTAGLTVAAGSTILGSVFEFTKDIAGDFSKPVTITLPFDATKVDMTKFDVVVCYFNETTKAWVPLDNVKIDSATGKVSGDVTHFTKFAVMAQPKVAALTDVAGSWAAVNINKLVSMGAIKGYTDGTFKPDNNVTRAEFVTVLVKAFNLAPQTGKVFSDTGDNFAKDAISTAVGAGIVSGYSATTFGPSDPITREQMAIMIVKAAKLAQATSASTFTDSAKISAWAKSAVDSAVAGKIFTGKPGNNFDPQGLASRAEMATVIVKALK